MFCEKCGAKLGKDAEFCRECGAKVIQSDGKVETKKDKKNETKAAKKKRKSPVLLIVIIVVLLVCAVAAVDYFGIVSMGLTDFLKDNESTLTTQETIQNDYLKTVEETREENQNKTAQITQPNQQSETNQAETSQTDTVDEGYADVVYTMKNNFFGEWVLLGYKEYLEDEIIPVDTFKYVILKDSVATMGLYSEYFTDDIVHNGPYGMYFNYRDSGGINNYNYLDLPDNMNDFMMDEKGRLLEIHYYGDGSYRKMIYVYEKVSSGYIESYLNFNDKSMDDVRIEKDDYVFAPITSADTGHLLFADIFHWYFVGFAENPYYDGYYDPESMLSFAGTDSYNWESYFKLNYDEGEYYSSSAGYVDIYTSFVYSDEYGCNYYRVDNFSGENVKSLNIFIGMDSRAYVSIASTDENHECISHFYVYEMTDHDYFNETINLGVSTEYFYGYWKSTGKIYYTTGNLYTYKEGDFDIYAIYPDGDLDFVQHIEEYGEDALYTYNHDYEDMYNYLKVNNYYSNPNVYVNFFINYEGQLVAYDYVIDENGFGYVVYSLYDPYDGSLEECIDECFAGN